MSFSTVGLPSILYRVTRSPDPLAFTDWIYINPDKPGRWDDPQWEYRVLYTADSIVAALTEVLQDLRPRAASEALEADVVDEGGFGRRDRSTELSEAVVEHLRNRWLVELLATRPNDRVVRVAEAPSRTQLERSLGRRLKIGDFNGSNYILPGLISRIVFEADGGEYAGMACPSAELPGATCYTLFETGQLTRVPRAALLPGRSLPALDTALVVHVETAWGFMLAGQPAWQGANTFFGRVRHELMRLKTALHMLATRRR